MEILSLDDKVCETPDDPEEKLVNDILLELSEYIETQIIMSDYKKNLSINLSEIIQKFYIAENHFDSEIKKYDTLKIDQIKLLKSIYEEMLFQKFNENEKNYLNKIDKELHDSFNSVMSAYFNSEDLSLKFEYLEDKEKIKPI